MKGELAFNLITSYQKHNDLFIQNRWMMDQQRNFIMKLEHTWKSNQRLFRRYMPTLEAKNSLVRQKN